MISLSTTDLGQTASHLSAYVPRTPTTDSSDAVITSPSTYLFPKIPSLPGVWWHCIHMVHIWFSWMFRAFICPLLSRIGGLLSSRVPHAPSGHGLNFAVLSPVVIPRSVEPSWLIIHSTLIPSVPLHMPGGNGPLSS